MRMLLTCTEKETVTNAHMSEGMANPMSTGQAAPRSCISEVTKHSMVDRLNTKTNTSNSKCF